MGENLSFDLNAASWRHGHADEVAFIEALAERLDKSLPGLVRTERERKLFAKTHPVVRVEVILSGESFILAREGSGFVARKAKAVRDIVISTKVLPMKQWLAELSDAINAYAQEHEESRQSLEDFLL